MELRAYWSERTPQLGVCSIKQIDFEDNNATITNGIVRTIAPLDKLRILRPTGIVDSEKKMIYEGDYVENDKCVFVVEWNQSQTAWFISPIKSKINEDLILMTLEYDRLGKGYHDRKDLKIIGNECVTKIEN